MENIFEAIKPFVKIAEQYGCELALASFYTCVCEDTEKETNNVANAE